MHIWDVERHILHRPGWANRSWLGILLVVSVCWSSARNAISPLNQWPSGQRILAASSGASAGLCNVRVPYPSRQRHNSVPFTSKHAGQFIKRAQEPSGMAGPLCRSRLRSLLVSLSPRCAPARLPRPGGLRPIRAPTGHTRARFSWSGARTATLSGAARADSNPAGDTRSNVQPDTC
jgi:hypothetical protein